MQSNKQTSKNTTKETQTISNRRTDIILACFEACDKRLLEFLFFVLILFWFLIRCQCRYRVNFVGCLWFLKL